MYVLLCILRHEQSVVHVQAWHARPAWASCVICAAQGFERARRLPLTCNWRPRADRLGSVMISLLYISSFFSCFFWCASGRRLIPSIFLHQHHNIAKASSPVRPRDARIRGGARTTSESMSQVVVQSAICRFLST